MKDTPILAILLVTAASIRVFYPIYASTFIWAAVGAYVLYGEAIRPIHVVGMVLLVGGILCMSW